MSRATFNDLVGSLRQTLARLADRRTGDNCSYAMVDFGLSAFAVFFTQSPSFLAHQKAMQTAQGANNAQSLFGIQDIPSDNQVRTMLDPVPPDSLDPVYDRVYDALKVNWCELTLTDPENQVLYRNAWITDWPLTEKTVEAVVASGRARWKIENENNNTLKTKGYHLEHNFGHGKEHLAALLATLNILAFLFHTILAFTDAHYRLIRATLPSRKTFFQDLRALTRYLHFPSWQGLLRFMMRGLEIGPYAKAH